MDFQRLFLFLIFSLSVFTLWDGWQRTQFPVNQVASVVATPSVSAPVANTTSEINPVSSTVVSQQKHQVGQVIKINTDWLAAELSTVGGDLRHLKFLKQYDAKDRNKPFVLLQEDEGHTYIAQTGLLGGGLPTHNTIFTAQLKLL